MTAALSAAPQPHPTRLVHYVDDWDLMRQLLRMIEWDHKARHGWTYDTWSSGKRLKEWMDPDLLADLDGCWCGFGGTDNAHALLRSIDLFDRLARRNANVIGYAPFDPKHMRDEVARILAMMQSQTVPRITIQTERLTLRPPRSDDVDDYFSFASDPEYAFYAFPADASREFVERFLTTYIHGSWVDHPMFIAVRGEEIIGSVQLDVDHRDRLASLGYGFKKSYWGEGLATEAAGAVISYAFEVLKVEKVCARADPRNIASVRVLENLV